MKKINKRDIMFFLLGVIITGSFGVIAYTMNASIAEGVGIQAVSID